MEWKGFWEKETHPVYKGDVKDGVPNGLGLMIFPNGDKYEGEWMDGKQNGQGTKNYPDGRIMYVGYWKDGNYYGQGTKTLADGEKYVGEW